MKLWITGTDTGVGKTLVSSWISVHTGMHYWKPIQTGSIEGTDTKLWTSLQTPSEHTPLSYPESYCLKKPVSPHLAAREEHVYINPNSLHLPHAKHLLIEGAGGLFVPLNDETFLIDVIAQSGFPALLVSKNKLGTINHTCLSVRALQSHGIPVLGVILNGPENTDHQEAIEHYARVPVLAQVNFLDFCTNTTLQNTLFPNLLRTTLCPSSNATAH